MSKIPEIKKNIEPDMVGIVPFIPHVETPLGTEKGGSVEETLVMVYSL